MNSNFNKEIVNTIQKDFNNIAGIIINKDNDVLFEKYFNGYDSNSAIHIASITKSIISILYGIAIKQNYIKDINTKILDYFPNYQLKRGEKTLPDLTLKNLLTMTTPLKYKSEPYTKVYSSENWTKSVLDLIGGRARTVDFKYTTVGIHVLSSILTNVTGKSVLDFACENLFKYINIESPKSIKLNSKDEHINFIKNCKGKYWVEDNQNINTAGWGLSLTTRDLMKLGLLYNNNGTLNNHEILNSDWILESTIKQSQYKEKSYGYLWWIIDNKYNSYAAIGDNGNIIYNYPDKRITISILSTFKPAAKDRINLIENMIIPQII